MTENEVAALFDGMNPVKLSDGKIGLMIRCGSNENQTAGVQVPGEEDIRWIPYGRLVHVGGGVFEERGV